MPQISELKPVESIPSDYITEAMKYTGSTSGFNYCIDSVLSSLTEGRYGGNSVLLWICVSQFDAKLYKKKEGLDASLQRIVKAVNRMIGTRQIRTQHVNTSTKGIYYYKNENDPTSTRFLPLWGVVFTRTIDDDNKNEATRKQFRLNIPQTVLISQLKAPTELSNYRIDAMAIVDTKQFKHEIKTAMDYLKHQIDGKGLLIWLYGYVDASRQTVHGLHSHDELSSMTNAILKSRSWFGVQPYLGMTAQYFDMRYVLQPQLVLVRPLDCYRDRVTPLWGVLLTYDKKVETQPRTATYCTTCHLEKI